jgi:hypothetical protein
MVSERLKETARDSEYQLRSTVIEKASVREKCLRQLRE